MSVDHNALYADHLDRVTLPCDGTPIWRASIAREGLPAREGLLGSQRAAGTAGPLCSARVVSRIWGPEGVEDLLGGQCGLKGSGLVEGIELGLKQVAEAGGVVPGAAVGETAGEGFLRETGLEGGDEEVARGQSVEVGEGLKEGQVVGREAE